MTLVVKPDDAMRFAELVSRFLFHLVKQYSRQLYIILHDRMAFLPLYSPIRYFPSFVFWCSTPPPGLGLTFVVVEAFVCIIGVFGLTRGKVA